MPGTTPIYGFPYPESSDLVANYPGLGQNLAEDVETEIATKLTNPMWVSYTTTLTNITLGNGSLTARYQRIGKTVIGWFSLGFGSTTAVTGSASFTLPSNYSGITASVQASGFAIDLGTASYQLVGVPSNGNVIIPNVFNATTTYTQRSPVNATTPHTWTSSDALSLFFIYQEA